jgi:hypothetical protein
MPCGGRPGILSESPTSNTTSYHERHTSLVDAMLRGRLSSKRIIPRAYLGFRSRKRFAPSAAATPDCNSQSNACFVLEPGEGEYVEWFCISPCPIQTGTLTMVTDGPIPPTMTNSDITYNPNPFAWNASTLQGVQTHPSTPPGIYVIGVHMVSSQGPTSAPGYDVMTLATNKILQAEVVPTPTPTMSPTPVAVVSVPPTGAPGELIVGFYNASPYANAQVVAATPTPGVDPTFLPTPYFEPIWEDLSPVSHNGYYAFGFSFSSPYHADSSGMLSTLPIGRYTGVSSDWYFPNVDSLNATDIAATPQPLPCYNLSNDYMNWITASSAQVMSLAAYLSVESHSQPIIVYFRGLSSNGATAESWMGYNYPETGLIFWWDQSVINSGHNRAQVLFHELDHHFYQGANKFPSKCDAPGNGCTASFTYAGTTYVWHVQPVKQGGGYVVGQGRQDFEHLLIHNDLVTAFQSDNTGALAEAFGHYDPSGSPGISPTPNATQYAAIISAFTSATVTAPLVPTPVPTTKGGTPAPSPTPIAIPTPQLGLTCSSLGGPEYVVQPLGGTATIAPWLSVQY